MRKVGGREPQPERSGTVAKRNRSAAEIAEHFNPNNEANSQRQMAEHSVLNIEANGRGWKEDATPLGLGIMGYDAPG